MNRTKLLRELTFLALILSVVIVPRFVLNASSAAVNTAFEGIAPGIYGNTVAFLTPQAITPGGVVEVVYFDITAPGVLFPTGATGGVPMLASYASDFMAPSVYDSGGTRYIAFHTIVGGLPVINYFDITGGVLVNTGAVGRGASVYGDKIAFYTYEGWVGVDLNGDGDMTDNVIRYWDITGGFVVNTMVEGKYPSLYGNVVAFETYEGEVGPLPGINLNPGEAGDTDTTDNVIRYYNIATATLTNTGRAGNRPSLWRDVIAFETREQEVGNLPGVDLSIPADGDSTDRIIRYFNIPGPGILVNTGRDGTMASVSGNLIAFSTNEATLTPIPIDLNGDGDTTDYVIRYYDAAQGRFTALGASAAGNAVEVYGIANGLTGQRTIAFVTNEAWIGAGTDLNADGDTTDNIIRFVQVQMSGDINGDGLVGGILDLAEFVAHWGTTGPNPLWNPAADLNNDGVVNMPDMGMFAALYGTPGPLGDLNNDGIVDMFDSYIMQSVFGLAGNANFSPYADITDDGAVNIRDLATIGMQWLNTLEDPPTPEIVPLMTPTPTIRISPSAITEKVGTQITLNISISDASNLYAWQVGFTYNSSVLQIINATEGEFLKTKGVTTLWVAGNVDNVAGTMAFSGNSLTGQGLGVNGTGQLMTVTFNVAGHGKTSIHLVDGMLLNSTLGEINAVFEDGTVTAGGIAVTNVSPSKTLVGQGFGARINVTVVNKGETTETFNVTAYADLTLPIGDELVCEEKEVANLLSGETRTIQLSFNTTASTAKGSYIMSAVADMVPNDPDAADNSRTGGTIQVVMVGDVDSNGKVDIKDLALIARIYGVNYPDPRYDPNYDIDYNGKIDIRDLALSAANYGKIDP